MNHETWDLDTLDGDQRRLLTSICEEGDSGAMGVEVADYFGKVDETAKQLKRLGLITIDRIEDEVCLALTVDGERWLLSLPEGSLS